MLERFVLPAGGFNDVRMAMSHAYGDNAAEAIQVTPALFVKQILTPALHKHDRFFVVKKSAGLRNFFRRRSTSSAEGPA